MGMPGRRRSRQFSGLCSERSRDDGDGPGDEGADSENDDDDTHDCHGSGADADDERPLTAITCSSIALALKAFNSCSRRVARGVRRQPAAGMGHREGSGPKLLGSACRAEFLSREEKPEGFKDYQRQSGSVGIISMLHQIIGDAKIMETKARVSLSDAHSTAAVRRSPCWGNGSISLMRAAVQRLGAEPRQT